ncbi:hypothetical protein CK203_005718 [Vitis vinifera]|uniref:Phosphatidylinositol N-acetylglucosaminyltransferase subunit H conserved domain-containing protein n=1 Tax=Vitis vinifera TaxID=29760 RepID=A0A438K429_VITVI|nr:hypothetical protein CK203_005718 [Vitis vinifera]
MTKIQIVNMRYTYIHDGSVGPHKKIDSHHIVIQKGKAWIFIVHLFLSLFQQLPSITSWTLLAQENFFTALLCSIILSAFLVKSLYQKLIVKESVVIFPAFGVQLETHYERKMDSLHLLLFDIFLHSSGRVFRRFIPIDKILKPVLNEHVTPFTCYWSLALVVRGKEELILAFKEVKLPVKMLIPIWKALCVATCTEETMDTD